MSDEEESRLEELNAFRSSLFSKLDKEIRDGWVNDSLTTLWTYKALKDREYINVQELKEKVDNWANNLDPEYYRSSEVVSYALYCIINEDTDEKVKKLIKQEIEKCDTIHTNGTQIDRESAFENYFFCYIFAGFYSKFSDFELKGELYDLLRERSEPSGTLNSLYYVISQYLIDEKNAEACVTKLIDKVEPKDIQKEELAQVFYCSQRIINLDTSNVDPDLLNRAKSLKNTLFTRLRLEYSIENGHSLDPEDRSYTPLQLAMLEEILEDPSSTLIFSEEEKEEIMNRFDKKARYKSYFFDFIISRSIITALPIILIEYFYNIYSYLDVPWFFVYTGFIGLSISLLLLNIQAFDSRFLMEWSLVEKLPENKLVTGAIVEVLTFIVAVVLYVT